MMPLCTECKVVLVGVACVRGASKNSLAGLSVHSAAIVRKVMFALEVEP